MEQGKNENLLVNLLVNVALPSFILMKGAKYIDLPSMQILFIALSLPFTYGLYYLIKERKTNFFSVLGFLNVLVPGLIGIFELPPIWVAVKEATFPFLFGVIVLVTRYTEDSWTKKFLYNEQVFNHDKINEHIGDEGQEKLKNVLNQSATYLFISFMVSAILNFVLARVFVHSMPGTEAFNEELGKMTLYSYPIILVPTMLITLGIIRYLYLSIKRLSGLEMEEIFMVKEKA